MNILKYTTPIEFDFLIELEKNIADEAEAREGYYRLLSNYKELLSKVNKDMLKNTIDLIVSKGLSVKLMVTITKDNYLLLNEICERVINLGVHNLKFTNCLKAGNATNLSNNFLTQEQINEFLELLKVQRHKYPRELLNIERCGTFGKNPYNSNFSCIAGTDIVAITPDLKVYPCNFLARAGFEIGYVSSDNKVIISSNINKSNLIHNC